MLERELRKPRIPLKIFGKKIYGKEINILGRIPKKKIINKNVINEMKKYKFMNNEILNKDKSYLWHPFTQSKISYDPIVIESAKGEKLFDSKGNEYIDLISSWWINTHGHCRDEMIEAVSNQSKKLEQVLFAGFTHKPAVDLAQKLVNITPKNLKRVFF